MFFLCPRCQSFVLVSEDYFYYVTKTSDVSLSSKSADTAHLLFKLSLDLALDINNELYLIVCLRIAVYIGLLLGCVKNAFLLYYS